MDHPGHAAACIVLAPPPPARSPTSRLALDALPSLQTESSGHITHTTHNAHIAHTSIPPPQWDVALVALVVSPLVGYGIHFLVVVTGECDDLTTKAYAKAGGVASETISNMRTVQALQCEDAKIVEYNTYLQEARDAAEVRSKRMGIANGLIFSTGNFMTGVTLMYVAYMKAKEIRQTGETDSTSTAFIAMFCIQQGAQGHGSIAPMLKAISSAQYAAFDILATINRKPEIDARKKGEIPSGVKGQIEFTDVGFAYPSRPDPPIYKGLNVIIEAGTTVAFVGSSGSGKSTAVQLIERFYDPAHGTVTLDGRDLKSLDLNWLRSQIALVGQEPVLFGGTIGQNIGRGKPGSTQAEIEGAAKSANAHDFIMEFPKGYDTDVGGGGGGGQLSGGQKQRVAIARAIIKDPAILLLDEATSALDNESERVVQEALDELLTTRKRTTLVIAHRLTTIQAADKIVVLDRGAVVEQGTHTELMKIDRAYAALVRAAESEAPAARGAAAKTGDPTMKLSSSGNNLVAEGGGTNSIDMKANFSKTPNGIDVEMGHDAEAAKKAQAKKEKEEKAALAKIEAKKASKAVSRVWSMIKPEEYKFLYTGILGACIAGFNNPFVGIVFVKVIRILYMVSRGQRQHMTLASSRHSFATLLSTLLRPRPSPAFIALLRSHHPTTYHPPHTIHSPDGP